MMWLQSLGENVLIATFDFTTHLNKNRDVLDFLHFIHVAALICTSSSGNPMETHKNRTTRTYYCSLFLLGWRITWVYMSHMTWLQSQRTLESTIPSHWQPGNEFEVFSQGGLAQDDWWKDEKEIYRKIEDVLRYHVSQKRSKQKCSKPLVQNTYGSQMTEVWNDWASFWTLASLSS